MQVTDIHRMLQHEVFLACVAAAATFKGERVSLTDKSWRHQSDEARAHIKAHVLQDCQR